MFLNAGMFDLAKFKEYFKSNPASTILKDREKDAELLNIKSITR
jgi:peptidyl-prolyl cis-trans isomerase D